MKGAVSEELPRPATADANSGDQEQRIAEIISRGQQSRPGGLSTAVLSLLSAVLLWGAFTPVDWGPLAWIALVPVVLLTRPAERTRWMYRTLYACSLAYWIVTLQWMRLGDPTMVLAMLALAAYLAIYWPLSVGATRILVHRYRLPLVLAFPVAWTGFEYARAFLLSGFSWYYLGHSQHRWVEIIQISDLFGAFGVTFLVAAANAALGGVVPLRWLMRWQLLWPSEAEDLARSHRSRSGFVGVAASCVLIVTALIYGSFRRLDDFPAGPRVALIQGNFVASVRHDQYEPEEIYMLHRQLTGMAVAERPDVVVWPEAMFPYPLYEVGDGMTDAELKRAVPEIPVEAWRNDQAQQALRDLADMTDAAMVIGVSIFAAQPAGYALYNSAAFVQPGVGITDHYDKIHRVPFGEYIPLREQLPFLQALTPFRGKFGIDRGEKAHVFKYQDWSLIPLICFEDTVPSLVRRIAASAQVNNDPGACLVNLTNDGWFHGSSELDQHLITASFRAVETRAPLVRAVNTGISAIIDGDGVIREPQTIIDLEAKHAGQTPRQSMRDPRTGRFYRQWDAAFVGDVPLDPRSSLYVATGDWMAGLCLLGCLIALVTGLVRRGPSEVEDAA